MSTATAELLEWHATATALPDGDITVLCWLQPGDEWFAGWWDGHCWVDAATGGWLEGVTHWAEPEGPAAADSVHRCPACDSAETSDRREWMCNECGEYFEVQP